MQTLLRRISIMAIVSYTLKPGTKLTKEQKKELREAAKMPIVYDEDCPEFTAEQYAEIAEIARKQREERKRKVVAIRIKSKTLEKAKKLGKGYTTILSRMIDLCIDDQELLEKCL